MPKYVFLILVLALSGCLDYSASSNNSSSSSSSNSSGGSSTSSSNNSSSASVSISTSYLKWYDQNSRSSLIQPKSIPIIPLAMFPIVPSNLFRSRLTLLIKQSHSLYDNLLLDRYVLLKLIMEWSSHGFLQISSIAPTHDETIMDRKSHLVLFCKPQRHTLSYAAVFEL